MKTNLLLDTRVYDVEFPDGRILEYFTNTIIEFLIENANDKGETMGTILGVVEHKKKGR